MSLCYSFVMRQLLSELIAKNLPALAIHSGATILVLDVGCKTPH